MYILYYLYNTVINNINLCVSDASSSLRGIVINLICLKQYWVFALSNISNVSAFYTSKGGECS
jgi:hypothetical protein